jgi:hypothetical protein
MDVCAYSPFPDLNELINRGRQISLLWWNVRE